MILFYQISPKLFYALKVKEALSEEDKENP